MESKQRNLCSEIYKGMGFGTKNKDVSAAVEWLETHKTLHCWVDGKYWAPENIVSYSEINLGEATCHVADGIYAIQTTFKTAAKAQGQWEVTNLQCRLTLLNEISRKLSVRKKLFTHFYDLQCQTNDFDLFLDYFNFYSSCIGRPFVSDWKSIGTVLAILSDTTPVSFLAAISAAALWAGCSIIIKPSMKYPVFPFILAEICSEAGLPDGLVNVVPGSSDVTNVLCTMNFGKIIFSGSYHEIISVGHMVALHNFSPFIFGHTTFIIFESCDMDGAIDKLFSENWECGQQGAWSTDLIVVEESIYEVFMEKLTNKMKNISINDFNFKFKENEKLDLEKIMMEAEKLGVKIYMTKDGSGTDQILIAEYDLDVCDPYDPITKLLVFKTARHAVEIVNKHPFCLGTSIWTENLSQAMEVSSHLETCTIWINCHGVGDASVPVEMIHKSGAGVFGGVDGGLAFLTQGLESWNPWKLIDSSYTYSKDFNEMIQKSTNSFKKWKSTRNRKEYLLKVHEQINTTMELKSPSSTLSKTVKFSALSGSSYNVTMRTRKYGVFPAQSKKPMGIIAMLLNEGKENLKNFVSWVTPAIAMGNVVIIMLSEEAHAELQPIIKCFVENLPNGVLNVVKGLQHVHQLMKNPNIQAIWTKNNDCSVLNDISSTNKFSYIWSPPCSLPMNYTIFEKHCLRNQVIWFPTINSSG